MRNTFLYFSKNKIAGKIAKKYGLRFGASRFVAGETIPSALLAIKELNEQGVLATIDHLGEFVNTQEEAQQSAQMCIDTLRAIAETKVNANLSLKMTQLGLDLSTTLCMNNMRSVLIEAKKRGIFVRIDMEDYSRNQDTIAIFKELREEFDNVGLVIQAYLFKSFEDINDLGQRYTNLRICKGAYKESSDVAYPEKKDVDDNYLKLVKTHLKNGNYAAIATHDDQMISDLKQFIEDNQIPRTQFEFQMLYGIRSDLQVTLAKEGFTVRAYVPYGDDWYGYFMRRLAERPANVGFVLKSMFK